MEIFQKIAVGMMIAVVLSLFLEKQSREISMLLILLTGGLAMVALVTYLSPIIQLLSEITAMAQIHENALQILIKSIGIVIIGDFAGGICSDAGYRMLSQILQTTASIMIISLAVPLIRDFLSIIQNILLHI